LCVYAHATSCALDSTFQYVHDAERFRDLAQIATGTALILQCRSATDDF
jgi:hypothetical protein